MLWMALRTPRLAREIFPPASPAAVFERDRVIAVDTAAAALGLQAGMRRASALAMVPELLQFERNPLREQQALEMLACWAGRFTPQVVLQPPEGLLLDIGGSLRLFGGIDLLLETVLAESQALGHEFEIALAPTAQAAWWLVLAGGGRLENPAQLRACLGALPLGVLDPELADPRRLATLGLRRLGELFELPSASLARRFGPQLPRSIACALGQAPDLRPGFRFPEQFLLTLELPAAASSTDALLFAARRLVAALAGWLASRQAGILACTLVMTHPSGRRSPAPTRLELVFSSPTRDAARIERVLQEQLAQVKLVAAVESLRLEAGPHESLAGLSDSLFGEAAGDALAPLIERLRARLGGEQVLGWTAHADHRPEYASQSHPATAAPLPLAEAGPHPGQRPLWLLPEPQALPERDGRPDRKGPLHLLNGPERIESGWWDAGEVLGNVRSAGDIRRDYFIARSAQGECLWIFRDGQGWWLHGLFA